VSKYEAYKEEEWITAYADVLVTWYFDSLKHDSDLTKEMAGEIFKRASNGVVARRAKREGKKVNQ